MLALELLDRGCKVSIVCSKNAPSSSSVAAGLFNPVVFKRLTESWRASELIPFLKQRYGELEKKLNSRFFYLTPISKIIATQNDLELWKKKREVAALKPFLADDYSITIEGVKDELLLGDVKNSGYVDLKVFLKAAWDHFHTQGLIIEDDFDFQKFAPDRGSLYKNQVYDGIVFCEGYYVKNNPYFSFVPFKPVNGDVLSVKIPSYTFDKTLNKNFFLLPFNDGTYRLGATYNWDNLVFEPSEEAKEDLLKRVKDFIDADQIEVVLHEAGVRPSSADRRPILGTHPKFTQLHIFNGLGTKGVMLAPFFANQMVDYLVEGKEIDQEVSVERFYLLQ